ncbi:LuxR family transcriptional regulator, quorum sensing-dependent transcriptional regulator [Hyphomicrobium facile]|uniref:LuxR family transcriptional regulator, quorum sensing-dependent transcriptional regulator n=2 Tax=Hyphomicrobium facile TaxID=51670 RepID=A0A1I7NJV3_9HYPH|nr:LuxR family transcriptional regulator, quorum sensing-dependent transcriptional regulator [Hyphomicrobium facile]
MPTPLATQMLRYTEQADALPDPAAVLNSLDEITWSLARMHVLGGGLLPLKFGTTESFSVGKTVFLHKSVPKEWWEERVELSKQSPAPADIAARLAMAPFTFSDLMKSLEPIGIDRWAMELNLKYGIRDSFGCPIGGRWIFAYWSPKLTHLEASEKSLLYLGAAFATKRLQQLSPPFADRLGNGAFLTPRELAVLRALSLGRRAADIGRDLALGEETVRSHIKKAQTKLGVRTPIHAVAQAVRLRLIP